ncbi:MAG: 16S rRNA (cytosine(967)-C(5))-methyltransferase RsmB [Nitrospirota bacterium]
MSNARLLAIKVLVEVFQKRSRPKQSIENHSSSIDSRDRAFMMEIVYGVLRFRDALDWILKHFLENTSKPGIFTLNNLRMALYQIYFMRTPYWAVVNESVEIEKAKGKPSLVNAVLRNILRQKKDFDFPFKLSDPVLNISINTSHPKWLIRRWITRFGEDETMLLAAANNRIPPFTIRVNTLRCSRKELLLKLSENGVKAEPTVFSPDGILLEGIHSYQELSFIHGSFSVQDEASQLIAYLLNPEPGERILDACAAPGGKTTHMAQLMQDRGEIVAAEKDPLRISRLRENLRISGIKSVKIINADINNLKNIGTFDRILLDAPCSSLGVIRRNPDVKYRHGVRDLLAYKSRQIKLLNSASNLLSENGILVYSVCSTEPEEGEDAINEFLKTAKEFRIIDADIEFIKKFTHNGFFRTYPHRHNMDGFFGVILCRKE